MDVATTPVLTGIKYLKISPLPIISLFDVIFWAVRALFKQKLVQMTTSSDVKNQHLNLKNWQRRLILTICVTC